MQARSAAAVPSSTSEAQPGADRTAQSPSVPVSFAGVASTERTRFRLALVTISIMAAVVTLTLPGVVLMLTVSLLAATALERPVRALRRRGLRRNWDAAVAACAATFVIVGTLAALAPLVLTQLGSLIETAPQLIDSLLQTFREWTSVLGFVGIRTQAGGSIGTMLHQTAAPAATIVSQSLNALLLLVLVPFVTYFMLASAPATLQFLRRLPPQPQRRAWLAVGARLRRRLGGYLRGLVLIALVQAAMLATMLGLIGLNFGIVIGILAGLSSVVPVIGNLATFAVALIVAIVQFDTLWPILLVVGAFGLAQVLETAILQPMLMGDAIAVPPLVMIVALIVGGSLFGALGAIVAVPAAAAGGVIIEAVRHPPLARMKRR